MPRRILFSHEVQRYIKFPILKETFHKAFMVKTKKPTFIFRKSAIALSWMRTNNYMTTLVVYLSFLCTTEGQEYMK